MQKLAFIAFSLAASLAFTACPPFSVGHTTMEDPIENFALAFTVENKTDTPVKINIRSYQRWAYRDHRLPIGEAAFDHLYSPWTSSAVDGRGTTAITNDMSGNFVLLHRALSKRTLGSNVVFSFEIEVEMPGATIRLAGYETDDLHFADTGLCYLSITQWNGGAGTHLDTKLQTASFRVDYVLPVTLVIDEDGSISFLEEMLTEGNGILISKPPQR